MSLCHRQAMRIIHANIYIYSCPYHGLPDVGQPALGFALGKLQTADVFQTSFVLAHLFVDDQLHTPATKRVIHKGV